MQIVTLNCAQCEQSFDRAAKEHRRQVKQGRSKFYCSLSCSGVGAASRNFSEWNNSDQNLDHLRKLNALRLGTNPFRSYARYAKMRSRTKNIPFDLTVEYLEHLWKEQDGKCAWSRIPLTHCVGGSFNTKASLDRKNSDEGYVSGNVQFVSCALNFAKGNRPDSEIVALLALIRNI